MHIRVAPPVDKPAPSKAVRGASSPSAAVMCRSPVDPSTPTFDPARTKLLKVVPSHVLLKPIDALLAPAPSASGRSCASHVAGVRKLLPLKLDMCIDDGVLDEEKRDGPQKAWPPPASRACVREPKRPRATSWRDDLVHGVCARAVMDGDARSARTRTRTPTRARARAHTHTHAHTHTPHTTHTHTHTLDT